MEKVEGPRPRRRFSPDSPGFPCTAVTAPGTCPIDHGIDVALAVRDLVEPRPTRYEVGVSCAIRSGVPVAEHGTDSLDPFDPWVIVRVDDENVVAGVETVVEQAIAVRVLDAVQSAHRTHDQLDIHYHPTLTP